MQRYLFLALLWSLNANTYAMDSALLAWSDLQRHTSDARTPGKTPHTRKGSLRKWCKKKSPARLVESYIAVIALASKGS